MPTRAIAVRSSASLTPGSSHWVHTGGLPVLPAWPKVAVARERRTPWPPYLQATPATRKLSSSGCAKLNKILRSVLNCRPLLQRSRDASLDYTLRTLCPLRSVDTALGCFCEKPLGPAKGQESNGQISTFANCCDALRSMAYAKG